MSFTADISKKIKSNFFTFAEVQLFAQILLLMALLPLMLRWLSFATLFKILTPKRIQPEPNLELQKRIHTTVKFTDYLLRLKFWRNNTKCLKRALIFYHFLHKSGIKVQVCFGVRTDENLEGRHDKKPLKGHAWLLYRGDVFLEKNPDITRTYTVTWRFPNRT